jgi:hypothetical protein
LWYGQHLGKDDLKAYALCLLVLFGMYSRYVKHRSGLCANLDPWILILLLDQSLNVMHRFTSLNISVTDSRHFGVDPDSQIHASD